MSEQPRPLYHGYRPPKKGPNWPMIIIWSVFGLALLAFLFSSVGKSGRDEKGTPEQQEQQRIAQQVTYGTNVRALRSGGCYQVTAETPLYESCKLETSTARPNVLRTLPAGSVIDIRSIRQVGDDPWYQVKAIAEDGHTYLANGWIDCGSLEGQRIRVIH